MFAHWLGSSPDSVGDCSQNIVVRPSGFEPPTFCSGGKRSIQLSYGRTSLHFNCNL
jgi:hypothetical protein